MKFNRALTILALAASACAAQATQTIWTADLSGANEAPANDSKGTGLATLTFDDALFTMRVQATFSGLTGNVTAAHIHCCTSIPGTANVGVATQTPSFTGFPTGVTSGSYDQTFDLSLASSYNAGFITANGGTTQSSFNALLAGVEAGKAYFNIHTNYRPGGEIRGFFAPFVASAVPEPTTYAMMGLGLAVLGASARRRRLG